MRANIGEHFTDAGEEKHVVIRLSNTFTNSRDQVFLDIQYTLQKLQQTFFFHIGLNRPDLLPQADTFVTALTSL